MAAKKAAKPTDTPIELPPLDVRMLTLSLVGDSPLICNAWSEKAKRQMLSKQMKEAKQGRAAKNPEQDYLESLYPLPDGGYGFPAVGFKSAAVDACSHIEGVTKVSARGAFHIIGDMVTIDGVPSPREDMVRVGMGTADIRYRGEFRAWRASITARFNASVISPSQIVNLFNVAGFAIGVGEWRPQRDGSFGMFHVATDKEVGA
ncbi:MAG: hypothetical protein ACR2KM_04225 [Gemmatimonadaceae bacterium]